MKIELVSENLNTFTLVEVSPEIENLGVSEVILDFGQYKLKLDGTTSPASHNFINPYLTVFLEVDKSKFNGSGVYEFDYYIKYLGHRSFNITERNLFNSIGILDDFYNAEVIGLEGEYYEIDKTKSSDNQLFLKTPVNKTSYQYYEIVLKDRQFIVLTEEWKKKFSEKITELSTCDTCQNIDELTKIALHLTSLKAAERCNSVDEAKSIANFLKDLIDKSC